MSRKKPDIINDLFIVDSENIYENELVQQCFNIVGVFVAAVDLTGNITLINNKGAELLEYEKDEIIGKNFISNFVVKEKQKKTKELFDSVMKGKSHYKENTKYYIQGNKNKTKIIEAKNVTICDKNNNFLGLLISGKDITGHIKKQKDLQTNIDLYRILANNIPDINLFLFDKSMNFILAEGNEMKNNDFSRDYFENKNLEDLSDKELKKIWVPLFKSALRGNDVSVEYNYNNYYYYMWVLPIYDRTGEIERAVAITQNVTEEKRIERQLKKSKEEAEKANRSKTDFLARVSHEIRTPLNAILGFAEQLKQSSLDKQQKEYIRIIEKSSDHLLSLINDILVLSKIEARQVRFEKSPFKLGYTVKYVHSALLPRAKEKNLKFTYQVDEKLNQVLLGDPFRLRQILINMLSNAIKFTNNGYVEIKCFLFDEDDKSVKVRFDVIDTGIGISPESLETIFEKFQQADATITKRYGGTGLGLAICKNLIELQQGTLSVSSQVGIGTNFSFVIPYKKGTSSDIIPEDIGKVDSERLKGTRVLLVDDDNFNRLLGKTILDKLNCITQIARNGSEAIKCLRKNEYDIVLLDIHMMNVNGIEVAEFIRKKQRDKKTKILAVTAAVMKDDIHKYFQVGMNDFLIKPFKEANLFNKMCDMLGLNQKELGNANKQVVVKDDIQPQRYNLSELKRMANGNTSFINDMLSTFIENSEHTIQLFQKLLAEQNWKEVGEAAHKILPSYKHLGVSHIATMLRDLKTFTIVSPNYQKVPELVEKIIIEMESLIVELQKEMY